MLTIAEEILLLALDDDTGKMNAQLPIHSLSHAASGAILMDLALNNRIDTDLEQLFVVDSKPLGEPVLDFALARIARESETQPAHHWVRVLADKYDILQPQLLDRLVAREIVTRREGRVLWVFGTRRYPTVDDRPLREVKRRIMDVLLSDVIPDPQDIAIICLVDACELWKGLLHKREWARLQPRIEQVVRMDLIGRSTAQSIRDLQTAIRGAEAMWIS